MKHPFGKFLSILSAVLLIAAFLHPGSAEARRRGRRPRYYRQINSAYCSSYSWQPTAKSVPGGRAENNRVPFMTQRVHAYLTALNARGCGLRVNSTYRSCAINRSVGGVQKSRHLCGDAADTTGCSKPIAASVCRQQGMTYIEEGRGKFPHCQVNALCNQIQHD